jgi:hypothetical protein
MPYIRQLLRAECLKVIVVEKDQTRNALVDNQSYRLSMIWCENKTNDDTCCRRNGKETQS